MQQVIAEAVPFRFEAYEDRGSCQAVHFSYGSWPTYRMRFFACWMCGERADQGRLTGKGWRAIYLVGQSGADNHRHPTFRRLKWAKEQFRKKLPATASRPDFQRPLIVGEANFPVYAR